MCLIPMQQSTVLCTRTCVKLARKDKAITVVTAGDYFSRLVKKKKVELVYHAYTCQSA